MEVFIQVVKAGSFTAAGERLAHATGTFKFLSGLPVGGRRVQSPEASD